MLHEITVVSSRVMYTKFGLSVIEETFSRNGSSGCYRYLIVAPSVRVVAVTASNAIVFIRQFKYPLNSEILCLPAGTIEQEETSTEAATRELKEETGYVSDEVIEIGRFYPMAATIRQECAVVLALGCRKETAGAQELADDDLERETRVCLVKMERIEELVAHNVLTDGQAIAALYKVAAYLHRSQSFGVIHH